MPILLKQRSVLPGFGLALGYTVMYLSIVVLIPLLALFLKASSLSLSDFWAIVTEPRAVAAYELVFGASFVAAIVNAVFGFIVAWTLVRYSFPGKKLVDAIVDLPFAMPTAVSGIALATLFAPGSHWLGPWLEKVGIHAVNSRLGVAIALTFIGLPFVVRTLQPALLELDAEVEEASASLGADRLQTFLRVIFPTVLPAVITGFSLAFARAIGEYGSVIFISGNIRNVTEIPASLIIERIEGENGYGSASAIAIVVLLFSFSMMLLINLFQAWFTQRHKA